MLKRIFDQQLIENRMNPYYAHLEFREAFPRALEESGADPEVAGFKSIACYRTGLNISVRTEIDNEFSARMEQHLTMVYLKYEVCRQIRLEQRELNDYVVNQTMRAAGNCGKPGEYSYLTVNFGPDISSSAIPYRTRG